MIGKLSGIIDTIFDDHLILDVGGVGYCVYASGRTLHSLGSPGDTASLFIETHVREDVIQLFGFKSRQEQSIYKLLTSVQGVGARVGLAILQVCTPQDLQMAIAAGDSNPIRKADGVGPKLANRILIELKDKIGSIAGDFSAPHTAPLSSGAKTGQVGASPDQPKAVDNAVDDFVTDALEGLVSLGYGRSEAFSALARIRQKDKTLNDVQSLIRGALKELAA